MAGAAFPGLVLDGANLSEGVGLGGNSAARASAARGWFDEQSHPAMKAG
jgi:hypothetical protein